MPRIVVDNQSPSDIILYVPEVYYKTLVFKAARETTYDLTLREYAAFEVPLESVNARGDASVSVSEPVASGAAGVGQNVNVDGLVLDLSETPAEIRSLGLVISRDDATFTSGVVRVGDGYVNGDVYANGGVNLSLNGLTIEGSVIVEDSGTVVELANCTVKGGLSVGAECEVTQLFSNILGDVEVDPDGTLTVLPD